MVVINNVPSLQYPVYTILYEIALIIHNFAFYKIMKKCTKQKEQYYKIIGCCVLYRLGYVFTKKGLQ